MLSKQKEIRLFSIGLGMLFFAIAFSACARMGTAPTGGPRDLAPPVLLKALPEEGSTNFTSREVTLDFDEFIVLQNTDKIVTSPNISKISYRGNLKRLSLVIEDTLLPDRTYSINFKDAIGDLHESTPLRNYTYYFSTGNRIDSGRITGRILDAFNLQPVKDATVALYAEKPREYPVTTPPDYVAVSDSAGLFSLQYIREGCYFILAGSDENRNYLVEPTEEKTAFSSDCWQTLPLKPPVYFEKRRGAKESDTASYEAYQTAIQLRKEEDLLEIKELNRVLYLYQDKDLKDLLKEAKWTARGEISLFWYYKPDSVSFEFLPSYHDVELAGYLQKSDTALHVKESGRRKKEQPQEMPNLLWPDSLQFHYVPQDDPLAAKIYFSNYRISELRLVLNYAGFSDTLELSLPAHIASRNDTASLKITTKQNSLFFKDSLVLDFSLPLSAYNFEQATLTRIHVDGDGHRDTLSMDFSEVSVCQPRPDMLQLDYAWQPDNSYQLFLPSSCFTDYLGRNADTLVLRTACPSLESYGQLAVTLKDLPAGDYQLQVVDNNRNVLQSMSVKGSGQVLFEYVAPAYVSFVLVEDSNRNGQWDSGDYMQGRQPERRWFFPKTIRVEADWRVEETWHLPE